jgi:hypothetical protein
MRQQREDCNLQNIEPAESCQHDDRGDQHHHLQSESDLFGALRWKCGSREHPKKRVRQISAKLVLNAGVVDLPLEPRPS